jgi:hypothetical protein
MRARGHPHSDLVRRSGVRSVERAPAWPGQEACRKGFRHCLSRNLPLCGSHQMCPSRRRRGTAVAAPRVVFRYHQPVRRGHHPSNSCHRGRRRHLHDAQSGRRVPQPVAHPSLPHRHGGRRRNPSGGPHGPRPGCSLPRPPLIFILDGAPLRARLRD